MRAGFMQTKTRTSESLDEILPIFPAGLPNNSPHRVAGARPRMVARTVYAGMVGFGAGALLCVIFSIYFIGRIAERPLPVEVRYTEPTDSQLLRAWFGQGDVYALRTRVCSKKELR